jgi:hypothetical protein
VRIVEGRFDRPTQAATLAPERFAPLRGRQAASDPIEDDVEIVESAELRLQSSHHRWRQRRMFRVKAAPELAEMTQSADLDPEAMESRDRRFPTCAAVGNANAFPSRLLLRVEKSRQVPGRPTPRRERERCGELLEQVRVPLRAEEHAEQLATGSSIVPPPGA